MPQVCLYFHLHQPDRLREYTIFDLDSPQYYATDAVDDNKEIFQKVANKSYWPMLRLLRQLIQKYPEKFVFSLSITGVFLDQLERYQPELLELLQELVDTGNVEILAETYYHSLASLYSPAEFQAQTQLHVEKIHELFDFTPTAFRNTELIYCDWIGQQIAEMGFLGTITEAVDRYLHGQPKTQLYSSYTQQRIPLMLKHAELSDDIAFRFSANHHAGTPLTASTYVHWLSQYRQEEYVNLFMDFETFGEHQWEDTGIFPFFEHVVQYLLASEWNAFVLPSQVFKSVEIATLPFYKVPEPISWADIDRSITAWRDNDLQHDTLRLIYSLEKRILATRDQQLIDDWRRLQTSDHFYYMCIKWSADGDVHAYFSPYQTPFDAYNRFTTILTDLQQRLLRAEKKSTRQLRSGKKKISTVQNSHATNFI